MVFESSEVQQSTVLGIETVPTGAKTCPNLVAKQPTFWGWCCHRLGVVSMPNAVGVWTSSDAKAIEEAPPRPLCCNLIFRKLARSGVLAHDACLEGKSPETYVLSGDV